jgi:hypothetical protein
MAEVKKRNNKMIIDFLQIVAFVVIWILLQRVVLPFFGIGT